MKVLDYGAERKWQGLSALSVPLLPKPLESVPSCVITLIGAKAALAVNTHEQADSIVRQSRA